MDTRNNFLESCLFFNTNALSRYLLKLAEKEFKPLGLSPAHASLMLMVFDMPGISPKQLSQQLHLTPSTITRFIDSLEKKRLVNRKAKGKSVFIFSSKKGVDLKRPIAMAYRKLYFEYTKALGPEKANDLSVKILNANQKLAAHIDNND